MGTYSPLASKLSSSIDVITPSSCVKSFVNDFLSFACTAKCPWIFLFFFISSFRWRTDAAGSVKKYFATAV